MHPAILLLPLVLAGDLEIAQIVKPKARASKRICLVVDVSGSMAADLSALISTVQMIAQQPVDGWELSVIAFDGNAYRWHPYPKAKTKKARASVWAKLPDNRAIVRAVRWLKVKAASMGGTRILPALRMALAQPVPKLTIFVVTDGLWQETGKMTLKRLAGLQRARVKAGFGEALVGTLVIRTVATEYNPAVLLANAGGGGCYQVRERKPK